MYENQLLQKWTNRLKLCKNRPNSLAVADGKCILLITLADLKNSFISGSEG